MNAHAVLTEVVKPRPDLILLGAVPGSATEAPVNAVFGHDFVNTLFVSIQIIVGAEAVNLAAPGDLAFEWLLMPE